MTIRHRKTSVVHQICTYPNQSHRHRNVNVNVQWEMEHEMVVKQTRTKIHFLKEQSANHGKSNISSLPWVQKLRNYQSRRGRAYTKQSKKRSNPWHFFRKIFLKKNYEIMSQISGIIDLQYAFARLTSLVRSHQRKYTRDKSDSSPKDSKVTDRPGKIFPSERPKSSKTLVSSNMASENDCRGTDNTPTNTFGGTPEAMETTPTNTAPTQPERFSLLALVEKQKARSVFYNNPSSVLRMGTRISLSALHRERLRLTSEISSYQPHNTYM